MWYDIENFLSIRQNSIPYSISAEIEDIKNYSCLEISNVIKSLVFNFQSTKWFILNQIWLTNKLIKIKNVSKHLFDYSWQLHTQNHVCFMYLQKNDRLIGFKYLIQNKGHYPSRLNYKMSCFQFLLRNKKEICKYPEFVNY